MQIAKQNVVQVLGRLVLGVVLLATALLLVLVGVNWLDEAPTRLAKAWQTKPAPERSVPPDQNAARWALGFAAAPGVDPAQAARQVLSEYAVNKPRSSAPLPQVQVPCDMWERACFARVVAAPASYLPQGKPEQELSTRYERLLAMPAWHEDWQLAVDSPIPPFAHVLQAQRQYHVAVLARVQAGALGEAQRLLQVEGLFWRRVMAQSSSLLTKLLATTMLQRQLHLLARLHEQPSGFLAQLPAEHWIFQPLTRDESHFEAVVVNEWRGMAALLRGMKQGSDSPTQGTARAGWLEGLVHRFGLQPQATLNRLAAAQQGVAVFEIGQARDFERMAQEFRQHGHTLEAQAQGWSWHQIYNPMGKSLAAVALPDMTTFVARVIDLEGSRRMLALAAAAKPGADLGAVPASAASGDPYTGQAFAWDASTRELSFAGRGGKRRDFPLVLRVR